MIIKHLSLYLPIGTYSYNGYTWIVDSTKILKNVAFYPNKFSEVYNVDSGTALDCITQLELVGLARTIAQS